MTMKKGIRTMALLGACLLLLSSCGSEPKTQYSVNKGGATSNGASNQSAAASSNGNSVTDYDPLWEEDDYDPASEEDAYAEDQTVEELPSLVTPPATNTPIPVISGQYSGATPVIIDPIDKPTPTVVPPISFTYATYTAQNLNLTFEAPAGWTVDTSKTNTYSIQNPDPNKDYAATLVIRANPTNVEYNTSMLATEVEAMLNDIETAGFSKYSPSKTAERKGLFFGATGVYAQYSGTMTDGVEIAGRVAAVYKNNVLYTIHVTYPKAYSETYKTNVYDKLRDTLKVVTAE